MSQAMKPFFCYQFLRTCNMQITFLVHGPITSALSFVSTFLARFFHFFIQTEVDISILKLHGQLSTAGVEVGLAVFAMLRELRSLLPGCFTAASVLRWAWEELEAATALEGVVEKAQRDGTVHVEIKAA
ncbi:hypothetical protein Pyn_00697 [Prunus yedoensis var. nudiflora]|uniref:Uncharacterized protein n=1 Tax=Prunus yedoensis var. nudiflora TaxID=2094558 RepID=A0A315A8C2_PRUYE|nr:hypothetical protein Pyn_00697 [Prunus yedoensis var. nudiflora]